MLSVRQEEQKDQQAVLHLIREAFWNLYQPGADEHYFYKYIKKHPRFVPQLCLVAEQDGTIVGQIISYVTKVRSQEKEYTTVTFGPVCIDLKKQGQGLGSYLIKEFFQRAKQIRFKAVIIQGHANFYQRLGFVLSKHYKITDEQGNYSAGLLVYELQKGYLGEKGGRFISEVDYREMNQEQLQKFDKQFPEKEKFKTISQVFFESIHHTTQEDPEPENLKDMWSRQRVVE